MRNQPNTWVATLPRLNRRLCVLLLQGQAGREENHHGSAMSLFKKLADALSFVAKEKASAVVEKFAVQLR
jgi:hypothetical protein